MTMIEAANAEALELGLLLSKQQEMFGINMIDAMLPSDQFEIDSLRFAGYSEMEAKQMIFENRYCKANDEEVQREKYATISEFQLALRNSTLNSHSTPKRMSDGSVNSRSSSKSSLTRKVSFSDDLEQVKVFLPFDEAELALKESKDDEEEEDVVTIVPDARISGNPLDVIACDKEAVATELELEQKSLSPKSVTKSWSFFKIFKSSSSSTSSLTSKAT